MNRKIVCWGLCLVGFFAFTPSAAWAQANFSPDDISSILEDNALRDAATRYTSVLSFFFPEEATRLGFTSANNMLNDRSADTRAQALQAFKSIRESLLTVDETKLSPAKRAERTLLLDTLTRNIWSLEQDRLSTDPLYYAQAFDAVYDLLLLPANSNLRKQRTDLLSRVSALPKVAEQAKQNLTQVSPLLARLAMEKTYFAYVSFDEVEKYILQGASLSNDSRDWAETEHSIQKAKIAIRDLFDFFKGLSQQEITDGTDFRLGTADYTRQLKDTYQITDNLPALEKMLQTHFDAAQHALFDALQPFQLSAEDDEITVVEEGNQIPQVQPVTPASSKKTAPAKPVYVPPTANQFYAVAKQLQSPLTADQVAAQITKKATDLAAKWGKQGVLPTSISFKINPLSGYFAYQYPYLYSPAYNAFLLRVPSGNELAKAEMLQRDFNEPAYKMLISQELVPGRYYQNVSSKSNVRRLFGSPTLANGWTFYSLNMARQQGYLITDEELLFVAWKRYVMALSAWLDYRLNTLSYTYEQAQTFLTQTAGFPQEEATLLLNNILRSPAQAVSYVWGAQAWQKAAATYLKKSKDSARINALLLQVGNVAPADLNRELKRLYKKK